jgi:hypothetical protein
MTARSTAKAADEESVTLYPNGWQDAYNQAVADRDALQTALDAERTTVARLTESLKRLIGILNDDALEEARNEWGNTNVAVAKHHRDEALQAVNAAL